MNGWDVPTSRAGIPLGMVTELEALRAAAPGYDVIITSRSPGYRFEAIRRRADGPGPWCVISGDPGDLWRELAPCADPSAHGDRAARAPAAAPLVVR